MSLESAKAFVKKMQEDDDFQKDFFACSNQEARRAFIKEKGFEFTKEEMDETKQFIDVTGGSCCGRTCEDDNSSTTICSAVPGPAGLIPVIG